MPSLLIFGTFESVGFGFESVEIKLAGQILASTSNRACFRRKETGMDLPL